MSQRATWLGLAPDRHGCGIALLRRDGAELQVTQTMAVPWRQLAPALRALGQAPAVIVVADRWRSRWVQALARTLFPAALLVLVRRDQLTTDLAQDAVAAAMHFWERERLGHRQEG